LDPLLCAVNIESLGVLEGRGRPEDLFEVLGAERREERVEVNARLADVVGAGLEDFDRGRPYREDEEDAMTIGKPGALLLGCH